MVNLFVYSLQHIVRIFWILCYVNAGLDTDRCFGLVYVTNTTVETKMRVKNGYFHVNQSDSRSFRETSFHQ